MKTKHFILALLMVAVALLTACEKPIMDGESDSKFENDPANSSHDEHTENVTIRVSGFMITPFDIPSTRAVVDLTSYCSRLNFVVYKDGQKVVGLSQKKEDGGFGEVKMSLEAGTYKLLILAHSSIGGNPTVSDPENIKFTNATGYSDTFSYYGDLVVEPETKLHEFMLTRNVSCLDFTVNDEFPEEVKYMKFLYIGGSGVLNAETGYGGNVSSHQEKIVKVSDSHAPLTFHLFTFLQSDEAVLKVTVTALKADLQTVFLERTFEGIPMKHQMRTSYFGHFFKYDNSFSVKAETDWGTPYQETEY